MTASLFPLSSFISVSYDSARSFPSSFFRFFSLRFRVYSSSRPLCSFFLRIARSLFLPSCSLDFSRRHYPPSFSAPFHHLSFFCLFFCIFFLFFSLFFFSMAVSMRHAFPRGTRSVSTQISTPSSRRATHSPLSSGMRGRLWKKRGCSHFSHPLGKLMIFNFHSRGYARSLAFVSRHRLSLATAPSLSQRFRMSATETRGKSSESQGNVEFFLLADTLMSYARSNLLRKLSFWYITILEVSINHFLDIWTHCSYAMFAKR